MRGRRRIDGEEGHLVLAGVSGSTLLFLWLVGVFRMPFTGVTVLLFFCMVLLLGPLGGAPAWRWSVGLRKCGGEEVWRGGRCSRGGG